MGAAIEHRQPFALGGHKILERGVERHVRRKWVEAAVTGAKPVLTAMLLFECRAIPLNVISAADRSNELSPS